MPTALKLEHLMKELDTQNERELSELTKLSISQIRRCKILLSFSPKFQQLMLAPPSERYKSDFFIELQRLRGPALNRPLSAWVRKGDDEAIELILKKYVNEKIKSVTEFRKAAEYLSAAERIDNADEFNLNLEKFLDNEELGIESLGLKGVDFAVEAKEINRSASRLLGQIEEVDFDNIAWDEKLISTLQLLANTINSKLNEALLTSPSNSIKDADRSGD